MRARLQSGSRWSGKPRFIFQDEFHVNLNRLYKFAWKYGIVPRTSADFRPLTGGITPLSTPRTGPRATYRMRRKATMRTEYNARLLDRKNIGSQAQTSATAPVWKSSRRLGKKGWVPTEAAWASGHWITGSRGPSCLDQEIPTRSFLSVVNPAFDSGLWNNKCWRKLLAPNDPGFALFSSDPWYSTHSPNPK